MPNNPSHLLATGPGHGTLSARARGAIMKIIAGQLFAAVLVTAISGVIWGWSAAYSALVGAFIGVIPNYFFARRLLRPRKNADPEKSLREMYVGEFIKIAFTGALFVIAIKLLTIEFLIVVASFLAVALTNWIALLRVNLGESELATESR